jgi:hypothetical protein
MRSHLFTGLALAAIAGPAMAQGLPDGFTLSGHIEVEGIAFDYPDDTDQEIFGIGTVDLGFAQPGGGFGGFIGFDGMAYDSDFAETQLALYGALSYSANFGRVQIGIPRAALGDYIKTPAIGGLNEYDFRLGEVRGNSLPVFYVYRDIPAPLGIRYDGGFGRTIYGASYHAVQFDDADVNVLTFGVAHQLGLAELRGGLEHFIYDGGNDTNFYAGLENTFGSYVTGLMYSDLNRFGDTFMIEAYGQYHMSDALELSLTYMYLRDPNDSRTTQNLIGLAAEYSLQSDLFVEAGIVRDIEYEGTVLNASFGIDF